MKKLLLLLPITALTLSISGCVGGVLLYNPERKFDAADVQLAGKGFLRSSSIPKPLVTKEYLLEKWGAPKQKTISGEHQTWIYSQSGLSWAGIVLVPIIPIPLVVPTGHNTCELTFSNNVLISAQSEDRDGGGAFCGLFLVDEPAGLKPGYIWFWKDAFGGWPSEK